MKISVSKILSLLALPLLTSDAGVEVNLHEYASLISNVFDQNEESSVAILHSSDFSNVWEADLVFEVSKMLSERKIMSMSADFKNWPEVKKLYFTENEEHARVRRPLIVIFLANEKSLQKLQNLSEKLRQEERQSYLVLFMRSEEQPMLEFCTKPVGNPFALRLDAVMVVKCYDDNTLRAWYTLDGDRMTISTWAMWHPQTKSLEMILENKKKKIDLQGKVLTIGIVNSSALAFLNERGRLRGFYGDLLYSLKKYMNFTWKLGKRHQQVGIWNVTGKYWNGAMRSLENHEVDLVVAEMAMFSKRVSAVDFTIPLLSVEDALYVRKPQYGSTVKWSAYFEIFESHVWVCILLFMLITPLILTTIKMRVRRSYILSLLLLENYLNVWGIYCQQGLLEFPSFSPLRIVYFCIFTSGLVILNHYSAFLISRLTYPAADNFLPDMEAFINDRTYKLIVPKNSISHDFFKYSELPTSKAMLRLMVQEDELPETYQRAFDMVCEKKVGFYVTSLALKLQKLRIKCELHEVKTNFRQWMAMGLPKNSQYTAEINRSLFRFRLNGLLIRLKNKYLERVKMQRKASNEVTIREIAVLLAIVTAGIVLGVVILFIEKMIHRRKTVSAKESRVQEFINPENSRKWYNFENQRSNLDRYDENGELNIKFLRKDYKHKVVFTPGFDRSKFRFQNFPDSTVDIENPDGFIHESNKDSPSLIL